MRDILSKKAEEIRCILFKNVLLVLSQINRYEARVQNVSLGF